MHSIQERELHKALKLIKVLGCQFLVIDPNGVHHGDLKIEKPRQRQPRKYEYGTLKTYVDSIIDLTTGVGEVQVLNPKEFDAESIRSSVCHVLTKTWGEGTYTTHINKERAVEILRTA